MSSNLTDSLLQMLGGNVMEQLSTQLGADPATTQKAVGSALPLLMGVLGKNASSTDGASALLNALSKDHDGSVLNDLNGFVARGGDVQDGNGILRHTLGKNRSSIESALSQSTGLSADSTSNLLAMLAPIVMGALGQQTQQQGLDVNGLAQLLLGEKQHATSQLGGLAGLLDLNHDGSILDEVVNIGSKLLGGLFGSKN